MAERCGKEDCGGLRGCKECRRIQKARARALAVDPRLPVVDVNQGVRPVVSGLRDLVQKKDRPQKPDYVPPEIWAKLKEVDKIKISKRSPEEHAKCARIFDYLAQFPG